MTIQSIKSNWKTSYAGIAMIVGALTHLGFAIKNGTLSQTMVISEVMACFTGWGLLEAGDATKSEKDVKEVKEQVQQNTNAIITGDTTMIAKIPTETKT